MALKVETIYSDKSVIKESNFLMKEGVVSGESGLGRSLLPENVVIGERNGIATIMVRKGTISPMKGDLIKIRKLDGNVFNGEQAEFCGIGKEVKIKSPELFTSDIKEIIVRQV